MKRFRWAAVAASVVGVAASAERCSAQLPAVPAVPGVTAPIVPPVVAAPAAPAAAPRVGIFQRMKTNFSTCLRGLMDTPFGQLLNNATKPLSALTGGVVPTLAGKPTAEETKQPGAAGAAATGKKDAAEVPKRLEDVKFLGTLDCRYYPDASKALADGLRTDPNECVRYAAALALGRGCCCTKITIAALEASVSGFDKDGNPAERSPRVRFAAAIALEKCLACYTPTPIDPDPACVEEKPVIGGEKPKVGEQPKTGTGGTDPTPPKQPDPAGEVRRLNTPPTPKQVARALETLEAFQDEVLVAQAAYGTGAVPPPSSGAKGVFTLWQAAAVEPAQPVQTMQAMHTMQPTLRAPAAVMPATTQQAARPAPKTTAPPPTMTPPTTASAAPRPKFQPADNVGAAAIITPAVATSGTGNAEADAKAVEAVCVRLLRGATAADQHAAVRELVKYDWKQHPIVASALVAGAKGAFADEVRVDCIRHLTHHQMAHKDVLAGLADLGDASKWVKDEAAAAQHRLTAMMK